MMTNFKFFRVVCMLLSVALVVGAAVPVVAAAVTAV